VLINLISIKKGRSLAPSSVTAQNLTQTSAIITWWPSSSTFTHILTIDSIEHKTLRPGIYRYKLSNLQPNSSHLITVTTQIQSLNDALPASTTNQFRPSIHSSSIEFRTLPQKHLEIPQNIKLERDRRDHDNFILSWQPTILSSNDTTSNGIPVGGYSIYLDGLKIHQILNPLASSLSLSPKLLMGNGANSLLTIRSLSLDGSLESKDSEPFRLSNLIEDNILTAATKRVQINQNITESANTVKNRLPTNDSSTTSIANDSNRRVLQQDIAAKQSPPTIQPDNKIANLNVRSDSVTPPQVLTPINRKPPVPGGPIINIPKVSDARKPKNEPKLTANTDSDLYENNKTTSSTQKQSRSTKPSSSSRTSPNTINPSKLNTSSSSNVMSKKSTKESLRDPSASNLNKSASSKANDSYRVFIALFDYDPFKMSPNTDSCQEELPFKEGQLIKIYGEQDADGFFYGESNGKFGYIPCNMVSEVQVDDPEVVKHLLNENPQSAATQKSRSSGGTSSKATGSASKHQSISSKNQSFVPVSSASKSSTKNEKKCIMVALYDYDPQYLSPNADVDVNLNKYF
jgi:RIMS-binding protein 2